MPAGKPHDVSSARMARSQRPIFLSFVAAVPVRTIRELPATPFTKPINFYSADD